MCNSTHRVTPSIRCARCAITGAARTSARHDRRCARCAIRRAGHAPHTVCKVCHYGCGPEFRRMRPTVCKVCNSARRARPPYGVQCCAIPGTARTSAGCAPRCARCAIRRAGAVPIRCATCAIRRAGHVPHTVCNVCHSGRGPDFRENAPRRCARCAIRRVGAAPIRCAMCAIRRTMPRLATGDWPPATDLSVQRVPFRARPRLPRNAPPRCARCASRRAASRSPFPAPGGFHGRRGRRQNSAGFSPPSSRMLWAVM